MHVVDVQRVAGDRDIHPLQPARLARLPRQVLFEMLDDRQAAEDRVAELMAAQLPCGRHRPAHPERRAEALRVAAAVRTGSDHLLQRHHVGVERSDHGRGALRTRAAVEAPAAMNVVGRDAERPVGRGHYTMIGETAEGLISD